MERKLRVGVVGCGVMGTRHLAAVSSSGKATAFAIADRMTERRDSAAGKHAPERVFAEGSDLIADPDVEAVILATPAAMRDDLAVAALEAGKHVLVEKPVATSASVVERMIQVRGNLVAGCCSGRYHRFDSARASADFVATGALGDLRVIHCKVHEPSGGPPASAPPEWRLKRSQNGGGIFVNWGCYDLDYLLGICAWKLIPRMALARTWQVPDRIRSHVAEGSDAETYLTALIVCDGGTAINYTRGEYMAAHDERAWQIVGTNGTLNLTMLYQKDKVVQFDELSKGGVETKAIWRGDETWDSMQGFMIHDFIDACTNGREPQTSLEKALVVQKIADAVYRSAAEGRAVDIR